MAVQSRFRHESRCVPVRSFVSAIQSLFVVFWFLLAGSRTLFFYFVSVIRLHRLRVCAAVHRKRKSQGGRSRRVSHMVLRPPGRSRNMEVGEAAATGWQGMSLVPGSLPYSVSQARLFACRHGLCVVLFWSFSVIYGGKSNVWLPDPVEFKGI